MPGRKKFTTKDRMRLIRLALSKNPQPPEDWVDKVAIAAAEKIIRGLQSRLLVRG